MTNKTYQPKPKDVQRTWYLVDADGAILGRLASEVATVLRGKHKPIFAPHIDVGDHVIVVNASKVRLSGEKAQKKVYQRHTQYPGGLREVPFERMIAERPERVVEKAIQGMLPKTRLGRQMAGKLKVYAGPEHPHDSQKPTPLRLGGRTEAPESAETAKGNEE
ncbi:MAG: 50S ribosomal protein L13 [Actinomycetota bacterium]